MSEEQITIYVNDKHDLYAMVYPLDAYQKGVIWSSSDESIVKVNGRADNKGVVEGLKEGVAIIKATSIDNGKYATCKVNVVERGKIIVDGEYKNDVDMTYDFKDTKLDIKLECNIESKKVSDISSIKLKDDKGEITLKENQFTIKETSKGLIIKINPEVLENITGFVTITVTPSSLDDESTLTKIVVQNEKIYFVGDKINNFDDFKIIGYYSNSKTKIINKGYTVNRTLPYTFTEEDVSKGVSFEFNYSDFNASLKLYPELHVSKVEMSYDQITIFVDDVWVLNAKVYPEEAYLKDVTWSSSNDAVAKVVGSENNNGKVTGLSQGTAIITATSVDNGETAYCIVNVVKKNIKYKVNFYVGDTLISSEEVIEGHKVAKPEIEPLKEKYFFRYWTADGYNEYDFDEPVMSNLDLKAYFIKDNFTYKDNKTYGGKTVTGYDSTYIPTDLIIPSYTVVNINDKLTKITVTEIGDSAFWTMSFEESIRYLYIPKSIKKIGSSAFASNAYLSEVEVEDGSEIEEIDYNCFCYAGVLSKKLEFDLSKLAMLKKTGYRAFYGSGLTGDIIVPESVEELGQQTFDWCEYITSIKVHKKVKSFLANTFEGCTRLKILDLSDYDDSKNVPTTGDKFLSGCKSLEKIYVKNETMLNAFKNSEYWSDFKYLIYVKE